MSKTGKGLRLGTRGSALALWQANWTQSELERRVTGLQVAILPIKTTGDRIQDVPLAQVGGKGLFTKELDEALLDGRIDFAVHSLKDLPFALPEGMVLSTVTEREDPRDALVSKGTRLADMPNGARIGTSSLRRQAQLRRGFPALEVLPLRGNVDTRLRKLDSGEFEGIILAAAGLKRLGYKERVTEYLERDVMLSAVAQGALGLVCRSEDRQTHETLQVLEHPDTHAVVVAERALMASLEGSCQVPIAGYAHIDGDEIVLEGLIASLDGAKVIADTVRGPRSNPSEIGEELGRKLRGAGAEDVLEEIRRHGA